MNKKGSILIVDDNQELLIALKLFLSPHFSEIKTEKNPNLIPSLGVENYDIILLDMNFSTGINTGNEGLFWLRRILEIDSSAVVVFITAYGDVELAIKALKKGATDFIQKSWDENKILSTVLSAYKLKQSKLEVLKLQNKNQHLNKNIQDEFYLVKGNSSIMNTFYKDIEKVSATNANVLLYGENGSGKEVIARELHRLSDRGNEIFVSVDLGAISENLFESELFGHEKGSFTDANERKIGRLEIASGGTLFLDEIGNLSLGLQAKLLSVIQNKEIYRVGNNKAITIDIRLICATNKNLEKMVENNEFREDLLYRINTITLTVPPLRERIEDLPGLANYFLNDFKAKYKKDYLSFDPKVFAHLQRHSWPGNIRELKHCIEKAVILSDQKTLTSKDFVFDNDPGLLEYYDDLNLASNEKIIIQKALKKHKRNMSQTAKSLGINRSTLYEKLKKYDLQ